MTILISVRKIRKVTKIPFLFWYARHELVHMLLGLVYIYILGQIWGEINRYQIFLAVFGSLLIDLDHVLYYIYYGRHDDYSKHVISLFRHGNLKTLFGFLKDNHKDNTNLMTHNIYFVVIFTGLLLASFWYDWKARTIVFGAIVIHLIFDMVDDIWMKGRLNENWMRWGRNR